MNLPIGDADVISAVGSFNLLNHTNPSSYVGVQPSPLFRQPNAAYNVRAMQLFVQIHFGDQPLRMYGQNTRLSVNEDRGEHPSACSD